MRPGNWLDFDGRVAIDWDPPPLTPGEARLAQ